MAGAVTVTDFQKRVHGLLLRIPRGQVTTYGALARALGCGSPRAVGQALRANPFAPRVPCHRVVRADLALGGYQGQVAGATVRRKRALLEGEGVRFDGRGRVLRECVADI
ncbi:MAG TPA: MGMT family protein [Verrucomicrobiae bacterium]|nr:MGMT family protein [Verrucomicrobiae bacterium]